MLTNPVIESMLNRKSVRKYTDQQPTDEVIETVVRAGQQAPFAAQLCSVLLSRKKAPFGAPLWFTFCVDMHRMELIMAKRGWTVAANDLSLLLLAIQDVALMAENMVIAAESLGMGSCFLGMTPYRANRIQEKYHLPKRVFPLVELVMGYPAEELPPRPRYPLAFTLFEDRYPEFTALAGDIFGNSEMWLMSAVEGFTNPVGQGLGRQSPIGFNHPPFCVYPVGFNRIEPGTPGRQPARHNPHSLTRLFDSLVVRAQPRPHFVTGMPRRIIPNHQQGALTLRGQFLTTPRQILRRDATHRPPIHKAQPHLRGRFGSLCPRPPYQQPVTRQRLGVGVCLARGLLHQAQSLPLRTPGRQARLCETTPPRFVLKAQRPLRMLCGPLDQPVAGVFFRAYSGSGLVSHFLARFQLIFIRCSVARIVSPLTRVRVSFSSKQTSATKSRVQRLVGFPKSRGLRCNKAFKDAYISGGSAAWICLGRVDWRSKAAIPFASNACSALRTVCSSQPRVRAMAGTRSLRALAATIWQRRSRNRSLLRKPASTASCSSVVSSRMYKGVLIRPIVPLYRNSCLCLQ